MTQQKKAIIVGLIGNVIFGFSFMFSKICLDAVRPFTLLAMRFDIAFFIMTILVLCKIVRVDYKKPGLKWMFALALCQPILYFICENYGITYTNSVISGSMIAFIPIVCIVASALFLKERASKRQVAFAFVSFGGIICITIAGQMSGESSMVGILLLFGAILTAAVYNVMSRKLSKTFSAFERTYVMFGCGSLFFTVAAGVQMRGSFLSEIGIAIQNPQVVLSILFLGVLSSIVAFFCLNYAVGYLTLAQSTSFANISSIISMLAGCIFLHEGFSVLQLVGCVLIIIGVYQVNKIS